MTGLAPLSATVRSVCCVVLCLPTHKGGRSHKGRNHTSQPWTIVFFIPSRLIIHKLVRVSRQAKSKQALRLAQGTPERRQKSDASADTADLLIPTVLFYVSAVLVLLFTLCVY